MDKQPRPNRLNWTDGKQTGVWSKHDERSTSPSPASTKRLHVASSGKQVFTWLFRRGTKPTETNLKNVAKVRDFYGAPDESDLEQRLSEIESGFAHLVRRLRIGDGLDEQRLICEFVANLQIRTANLRSGVAQAMKSFIDHFSVALTEKDHQVSIANKAIRQALEGIRGSALENLLLQIPGQQRQELMISLEPMLREHINSVIPDVMSTMISYMPSLVKPDYLKSLQNKVLNEHLVPGPRVQQLLELSWTVLNCEDHPLILGDVGVIAGARNGELANMLTVEAPLHAVYLPISTTRLLYGRRLDEPPQSVRVLNQASAELSTDFFIASKEHPHIPLHTRIGARARLLSEDEMEEVVRSPFRDHD